jgi:hypothetical protein
MTWRIGNYSKLRPGSGGRDYYAWCVFLDEKEEHLSLVREVEYTLHPTFPNPIRAQHNVDECFALLSGGWGEFAIGIRIFLRNGRIEKAKHDLSLSENSWPLGQRKTIFASTAELDLYGALLDERWEWLTLGALAQASNTSEDETMALLLDMKRERFVERTRFSQGELLWGATCRIGLLPQPRP